jgi:hypothetical protein
MIDKQVGPDNVAAVLIEPIQGEGGFVVPTAGVLPKLAAWCAQAGVLLIADEIQTGFCRTGDWFVCECEDVVPDLVATAKDIAGGLPLAGVTGHAELMDAVHPSGLGGTYGGNRHDARQNLNAAARRIGELTPNASRTMQNPSSGDWRCTRSRRQGCCRGRSSRHHQPGSGHRSTGGKGVPYRRCDCADLRNLQQRHPTTTAACDIRRSAHRGPRRPGRGAWQCSGDGNRVPVVKGRNDQEVGVPFQSTWGQQLRDRSDSSSVAPRRLRSTNAYAGSPTA